MRLAEFDRPKQDKNFPRSIMPQVRQPDLDEGPFDYKQGTMSVSKLKPVQKQRVKGLKDRAKRGFDDGTIRPIIVDKNNYIVNGHHRYDVARELEMERVKIIKVNATIEDLIDHYSHKASDEPASELYADAGGGGGGGAGGGGAGGAAGGAAGGTSAGGDAGGSTGGDAGGTDAGGDVGGADPGDAPTMDAPVSRGFFGIGTMAPYKKKKKKKKKKTSSVKFGGSIYETIEAAQDLNALLQGIDADLKQRAKDLKKLPKKSIYEDKEPNYHFEWDEAQRYPEFKKLGKEKWIELAQKGKVVKIKDASKIHNTDAGSPEEFYNLDKDKQKRALQQIARNDVEMPIIARYSDNHLELIGGNTRFTAMMLRKGFANVWIFEVPDEVAELAEKYLARNLNPDVADYIKGKKTKLIKVRVADLDDDAEDDRFGRVIDVDTDVGVDLDEPILLDTDGKTILDGFHRVYQAKRVGKEFIPAEIIDENFADGKKKGKSRPGRVKKAGASCKGSVSSLRAKAKKYSGERGKMYHWCANMKGGKKK